MKRVILIFTLALFLSIIYTIYGAGKKKEKGSPLSPCDIVITKDGKTVYTAQKTGLSIDIIDVKAKKVKESISLPAPPTGLALGNSKLYVTTSSPKGNLYVIDIKTRKILSSIKAGVGACSPVLSPDNKKVYICNRFNNDISVIDLKSKKEISRIPVSREPVSAVITPDSKYLFVVNLLPIGQADSDYISSVVTVVDMSKMKKVKDIILPNGGIVLRGICISADGKYIYVTHNIARYHVPTTQLERGWMNTSALSIIDVKKKEIINTVLLDDVDSGAANPWGVTCTPDDKYICITHSGTHELSLIDQNELLSKLSETADKENVPNMLSFLYGLRKRIKLKGNGPRELVVADNKVYIAEYFSDTISVVGYTDEIPEVESIKLNRNLKMTKARRGEMYFNDASTCFQQWQSCASCHPDTRSDALNWDLLNDGLGNPKNTKSLLLSFKTPPVMITGIRADAKTCVRAGFKFIQFVVVPEEHMEAVDEFLKSLNPLPSPYLVNGRLSASAERGQKVFNNKNKANCVSCHSGNLGTDLKQVNMGEGMGLDKGRAFDTPTLVEVWRTAPYLYNGRAKTIKEVIAKYKHGIKTKLSNKEIDDLTEYVNSFGPLK